MVCDPDKNTRDSGQNGCDTEGDHNDPQNGNAQQLGGHRVFRYSADTFADHRPFQDSVENEHGREGKDNDENLDRVKGKGTQGDVLGHNGLRKGDFFARKQFGEDFLKDDRHADGAHKGG